MIETDIARQLLGPNGGLFALGLCIGVPLGWKLCQKNIVALHLKHIEDINERLSKQDEHCKIKIESLENRINTLEDDRVKMLKEKT